MAWAHKLKNGLWSGRYRDANNTQRTAPGGPHATKREAVRNATDYETRARTTHWLTPQRIKWADWFTQWSRTRTTDQVTRRHEQHIASKHLTPMWGSTLVPNISPHHVQTWVASLLDGTAETTTRPLKHSTVTRILAVLSASLTAATRAGIITTNPCTHVTVGGGKESHERYLTRTQLETVLTHLPDLYVPPTLFLAYTGLRWSELVPLQQDDINREAGFVTVTKVWQESTRTLKPYPKSRKPRTVPIPERTLNMTPHTNPVFTGHKGPRLAVKAYRQALNQAADKANIPRFRIHDLRHTYASWLIQGGVPLPELARLLGHSTTAVTERYAHLHPEPDSRISMILDQQPVSNQPPEHARDTPPH